jgi:DNA-3-methyladenine glycosylase II
MERFKKDNFHTLCDLVAAKDPDLKGILKEFGYPPLWVRPNTFETLVLTILEQQVSLASAYAAYRKLQEKMGVITPSSLLKLTDVELRNCYLSRQKIVYTRELAQAIRARRVSLKKLYEQPNEEVRAELKKLKGIGDWTADIYLIHALRRTDVFPIGDLALVNAVKIIKGSNTLSKEEIVKMAERWQPYRSIATMMFWHYYIKKRNIKLLH